MSLYDQGQDDIGAEMNERELRTNEPAGWFEPEQAEPDDQAMVGALLAQVGYLVTDLSQVDNVSILCDADRDTLAQSLHFLDRMLENLITVRGDVAQALGNLMETELELIGGHTVKRGLSTTTEWDRDGSWRAVRATIVDRWARDGATFDSGKAELIDRTLTDVKTAHNAMTPSVTGLRALSIEPNEYRATTRATRWSVKVT